MLTYISISSLIVNIEKSDIEMYFKKYVRKWRLRDVLLTLIGQRQ